MSQVATGTDPALAPTNGSGPAGQVPSGTAGDGDDFFRVSKAELKGMSWHDVHANHKRFSEIADYADVIESAKAAGFKPEEVAEYLAAAYTQQRSAGGQYIQPLPQVSKSGISAEEVKAIVADSLKGFGEQLKPTLSGALQEHTKQTEAMMQRRTRYQAARDAEDKLFRETLDKMGVKYAGEDGKPTEYGDMAYSDMGRRLHKMLTIEADRMGLQGEERKDFINAPPQEHYPKLVEQMGFLKDHQRQAVASAVQKQQGIKPTLGSGAGGKQPPPDWKNMSEEQRAEAVTAGIVGEE